MTQAEGRRPGTAFWLIYTLFGGRRRRGFPRAPLTYTLASHVRLPGGLQMIASSSAELNGILACFRDGATSRITYPAAYCCLTRKFRGARRLCARPLKRRVGR
jgi:hypothetical protein